MNRPGRRQVFASIGLERAKVTSFAGGTALSYRRPVVVSVFVARTPKAALSTVFLGKRDWRSAESAG